MTCAEDIMQAKKQLRKIMLAQRAAMSADERKAQSVRLAELAPRALGIEAGTVVSAFLSIGDELSSEPLLDALHAAGSILCLPVMQGKGKPLLFRAYRPGDALDTAIWGIHEPKSDQMEREPQLLLVPLLAFDMAGWRLGYGGGFYDRTLRAARARRSVRALGLAFDEQKVDAVPHLDYDEPLDGVLTPSGLIHCR